MKTIKLIINRGEAVEAAKQETANIAARAELMGVPGVFDVFAIKDEEDEMVKDWLDHSVDDLMMLFKKEFVGVATDGDETVIELSMTDNYNDLMAAPMAGYANKFVTDEILLRWMRQCESASSLKGVQSILSVQQAKVRDADWELLKSARNSRMKRRNANSMNVTNNEGVWIED